MSRQDLFEDILRSLHAAVLDDDRTGVIRLDRRGRVVMANDHARKLLRKGTGLSDRRGFLQASIPREDEKLQRLLAQALPFLGGPGGSGSMMVTGRVRLVLHVNPLSEEGTDLPQGRLGALVLVVDPASRAAIDPDRVGAVLGLTPAESQVAVSLAQGKTIRDIAGATGRSVTTIRWHIKHIFEKQGISRQVELVQLVMAVADLPHDRR